jgi:hypothetical protein
VRFIRPAIQTPQKLSSPSVRSASLNVLTTPARTRHIQALTKNAGLGEFAAINTEPITGSSASALTQTLNKGKELYSSVAEGMGSVSLEKIGPAARTAALYAASTAMITAAGSAFGEDPIFGRDFPTLLPHSAIGFIFANIPSSRWIIPKIALTALFMKSRFEKRTMLGTYVHKRKHGYIPKSAFLASLADIPILFAANRMTPDEIKYALILMYLGSSMLSTGIGYCLAFPDKVEKFFGIGHKPNKYGW